MSNHAQVESTFVSSKPGGISGLIKEWQQDVSCVFERDPAARSVLEVLTTYPGVHAVLVYRISHRLWRRGWFYSARVLSFLARFISNVDIHPGALIGRGIFIDHGACVVIGETAVIGDQVTLYHGVTLGGTTWNKGKRHPTLGNGVLVGTGAKILGPITVGDNARVGANSVVVQDVPASVTVVGIPGRVVNVGKAQGQFSHGIDLNHHLIPDPVGKAISCLLERIDSLEGQLQDLSTAAAQKQTERQCDPDNDFCLLDCALGAKIGVAK